MFHLALPYPGIVHHLKVFSILALPRDVHLKRLIGGQWCIVTRHGGDTTLDAKRLLLALCVSVLVPDPARVC